MITREDHKIVEMVYEMLKAIVVTRKRRRHKRVESGKIAVSRYERGVAARLPIQ
jgi:hypothetical protein